ncbi:hypothetical protein [Nesterenkonia ebinurensis]|uniref:hypothetical protein n=1 Tax=Nesterenkonia ebinurensis TaxID=2608252 RepID=UPI00123CD112|nr:hypothetical protein [Nesterenkonia ebinurensis]
MNALPRPAAPCLVLTILLLSGCEASPEAQDDPLGGGSLGSSVDEAQASAPEPEGEQLDHQQMRQALEDHTSAATITDTDDWWPHIRDLNRELQRLQVDPTDCKPYVTASALPVPTGALGALAEDGDAQTVIYSFEDAAAAQEHLSSERTGISRCAEHTVIRDLGEAEAQAETELTELELLSGAEEHLAVRRVMTTGGEEHRHLAVLLRHGALIVLSTAPEDPETEEDDALAALEAEAALVLSQLVGEEIIAPEPEPEEDEDEDEAEENADSDEEAEPEGSAEDGDSDD